MGHNSGGADDSGPDNGHNSGEDDELKFKAQLEFVPGKTTRTGGGGFVLNACVSLLHRMLLGRKPNNRMPLEE
jgi:hypothetical protein